LAPPRETVVDEDNCCQSQLIAESAVLPKADATPLKTDDATLLPTCPMISTTSQTGLILMHT
jgi:hypothetical protein